MKHTAGIIFYNKHKHVLILKPSGKNNKSPWSIPKGEVEHGEEPAEAAIRECKEEVGFIVENPENLIHLGSSIYKSKKKTVHVFLAPNKLGDDEPKLNWENSEYSWVSPSIAERVVHESQAPYMRLLIKND